MADVGTIRAVVTGKNLEVTPALRAYAEKRVAKLTKFFEHYKSVHAEILLSMQRELGVVEVTLRVSGLILRGVGKTEDMYASIDQAVERIERQLVKYKSRIQTRLQDVPKISSVAGNGFADLPVDEETAPHQIVRTKRFAIKPMSVEEAVLQMELIGHDFYVFANASTEEVNVVYRRKDGNYGLIEPEV